MLRFIEFADALDVHVIVGVLKNCTTLLIESSAVYYETCKSRGRNIAHDYFSFRTQTVHVVKMNKLISTILLTSIPSIKSQCQPCDITPNGWAVRPGSGCTEYINCAGGEEASVNTCAGGTIFDFAIGEFLSNRLFYYSSLFI